MEASLTRATKLHAMPNLLDKWNALGSPSIEPLHGEGSSFLYLPTKKIVKPTDATNTSMNTSNNNNNTAVNNNNTATTTTGEPSAAFESLDFKTALMAHLPGGRRLSSSAAATASGYPTEEEQWLHSVEPPTVPGATAIAWNQLNQLRVHAGAPERSEIGIQKLMQYYAQLCYLEDCFPFSTGKVRWRTLALGRCSFTPCPWRSPSP